MLTLQPGNEYAGWQVHSGGPSPYVRCVSNLTAEVMFWEGYNVGKGTGEQIYVIAAGCSSDFTEVDTDGMAARFHRNFRWKDR